MHLFGIGTEYQNQLSECLSTRWNCYSNFPVQAQDKIFHVGLDGQLMNRNPQKTLLCCGIRISGLHTLDTADGYIALHYRKGEVVKSHLEIGGGRGTGRSHCSALKSRPVGVSPRIPDLVSSSACACRGGVGLSELAWGLQRKEGRGWVKVK